MVKSGDPTGHGQANASRDDFHRQKDTACSFSTKPSFRQTRLELSDFCFRFRLQMFRDGREPLSRTRFGQYFFFRLFARCPLSHRDTQHVESIFSSRFFVLTKDIDGKPEKRNRCQEHGHDEDQSKIECSQDQHDYRSCKIGALCQRLRFWVFEVLYQPKALHFDVDDFANDQCTEELHDDCTAEASIDPSDR